MAIKKRQGPKSAKARYVRLMGVSGSYNSDGLSHFCKFDWLPP